MRVGWHSGRCVLVCNAEPNSETKPEADEEKETGDDEVDPVRGVVVSVVEGGAR